LVQEGAPQVEQYTAFGPFSQSAMDSALGTISLGQFAPGRAGPQNPENAFETASVVQGRSLTFSIASPLEKMLFDLLPLFIPDGSPRHWILPSA